MLSVCETSNVCMFKGCPAYEVTGLGASLPVAVGSRARRKEMGREGEGEALNEGERARGQPPYKTEQKSKRSLLKYLGHLTLRV